MKTHSGKNASQLSSELDSFVAALKAEDVRSYAEIGAREGDTFYAVTSSLEKGSRAVAVDLPGAAWGRRQTKEMLLRAVADLRAKGYDASAIFGDSHTPAIAKMVHGRGPFDAILIDGDHSLAAVTSDWEIYRNMARIVAFHDIAGEGESSKNGGPVEVPLLWQTIKRSGMKIKEIIAPQSTMGIGIVWMP